MRSLRMKMVMIMVILILALMLTTGAFLMSGVGNFYVSQFYEQMEGTFTPEFIGQLQRLSAEDNAPAQMKELLMAQAGLGIDITGLNVDILDQNGTTFRRTVSGTTLRNVTNLAVGRYVSFQFTYNLRLFRRQSNAVMDALQGK